MSLQRITQFFTNKGRLVLVGGLAIGLLFFAGFGLANILDGDKGYYTNQSLLPNRLASGNAEAYNQLSTGSNTPQPNLEASLSVLQAFQTASRAIADNVLPVVVRVDVKRKVNPRANPFEFFFNGQPGPFGNNRRNQEQEESEAEPRYQGGFGSGILVEQKGETYYVLTNNHVVDGADKYLIKTSNGKEYEANIVGKDANRDLAILSFASSEKLALARLGDSSAMRPGDIVFAIGSPYGIQNTVTQGIVSAVGRTSSDLPDSRAAIGAFTDYLQTDAAINPGNSGGALVNIAGEVVGINTWIATRTGENVGLGFAVPINNARKVATDFINKGKVEYGWLGVTPNNIIEENREVLGLKGREGAFVYNTIKDSPAEQAGLRPGDLITHVNNAAIKSGDDLVRTIAGFDAKTVIALKLIRQGKEQTLNVTLGLRVEDVKSDSYWPGFSVMPLTNDMKRQVRTELAIGSLVVVSVQEGTSAADAGLRAGDELVKINGKDLKNAAEFYTALNSSATRQINLTVKRNGREISLSWSR